MASKKFYRWALTFNVLTSLLSVLFSFVAFKVSQSTSSEGALAFVYYVKTFFDLLAVFTGYGTIMYAFTRYDFTSGVKATGIFSLSVLISYIWQVVGSFIGFSSDFMSIADGSGNYQFVLLTLFYACGYCFITQFVPALFVAFCTYFVTKKGTDKKTLLNLRLVATCVILLINIAVLIANLVITMVDNGGFINQSDVPATIGGFIEGIIIYGPIQFGMYYLTHFLYEKYTDKTQEATTNSKKNNLKKEINNEE